VPAVTPSRFLNADAVALSHGAHRSARLAAFLGEGDPLADAAVDALVKEPRAVQEAQIAAVLAGRTEGLPAALLALEASLSKVPFWFDPARADAGGEVLLRRGLLTGLVLGFKSLVLGYCSPAGNKPLAFSGRLTEDVSKRLGETARFVEAVCLPSGMRRSGEGFATTVRVRLMHARVRQGLRRSTRWDHQALGLPINQYDMAGTVLLFSSVLLEGLKELGAEVSSQEAEDVQHLWRMVGHVMGVDHELLCTSAAEAHTLWGLISATQGPPDEDSRRLTHALIDSAAAQGAPAAYVAFSRALCRHLVGAARGDQLGLPRSGWSVAPVVLRPFIGQLERAVRSVPGGRGAALKAGMLYWRRTVELGQGDPRFPMPMVESFAEQPR
jgi:hypothetical protein